MVLARQIPQDVDSILTELSRLVQYAAKNLRVSGLAQGWERAQRLIIFIRIGNERCECLCFCPPLERLTLAYSFFSGLKKAEISSSIDSDCGDDLGEERAVFPWPLEESAAKLRMIVSERALAQTDRGLDPADGLSRASLRFLPLLLSTGE